MNTHLRWSLLGTAALGLVGARLSQTPSSSAAPRMRAIVHHEFGSPDVLRLEEIEKPVPDDDQVLVRVRAASLNPLDWHYMEGTPYIARLVEFGVLEPRTAQIGVDFAGTVEAVGKHVTQFSPGDEVFGGRMGALAEYVCVPADRAIARKPSRLSFEQAAAMPIAAITALQSLRDKGRVQPGQEVLINGASGGVGTFAGQIAKAYGASVTGVCSTRNVDMIRSLGADRVIDYTQEDFTAGEGRYDLILDNVGNHSLLECRRALKPDGRYVLIGGGSVAEHRWFGPLAAVIRARMLAPFVSQEMGAFLADLNPADLSVLAELAQSGKVTPVIDKRYELSEVPEAMRYLEEGHARGKVVISLDAAASAPTLVGNAPSSDGAMEPMLVLLAFLGIAVVATIVPIVVALVLNRRFVRRNPGKRPYRWGYYFSILSFLGGLGAALVLDLGFAAFVACLVVAAVLAWCFARRHRWAWIVLTIASLNPLAWIINAVYLRKRWSEDSVARDTRLAA